MAVYVEAPFHSQSVSLAGVSDATVTLYDNCHTLIVTFVAGMSSYTDIVALKWVLLNHAVSTFGNCQITALSQVALEIGPASKRPGSNQIYLYKGVVAGTYIVNVTQVCGNEV